MLNTNRPLSETLQGLGFFREIGEYHAEVYNSAHGITVFYDERGRPWVIKLDAIPREMQDEIQEVVRAYRVRWSEHAPVPEMN